MSIYGEVVGCNFCSNGKGDPYDWMEPIRPEERNALALFFEGHLSLAEMPKEGSSAQDVRKFARRVMITEKFIEAMSAQNSSDSALEQPYAIETVCKTVSVPEGEYEFKIRFSASDRKVYERSAEVISQQHTLSDAFKPFANNCSRWVELSRTPLNPTVLDVVSNCWYSFVTLFKF